MPVRPTDLRRAAEQFVAQSRNAHSGTTAVLWQKSYEAADSFARRVEIARQRLPGQTLLVAVCVVGVISSVKGICAVELPSKMLSLFDKPVRYRVNYGGRAAGRSWGFARALLVKALEKKIRVLCAREFQNSINDSIHALLADQISLLGLNSRFEIQNAAIYGSTGSEFIFNGIKNNVTKIKSGEGIDICFVEEAEKISHPSWEVLIPTIRKPGSEIWAAWNPNEDTDPTYERFVTSPPENAIILKTTYEDNPFLSDVSREELERCQRVDDDAFRHVWLGETRKNSDAQVFKNKFVTESFEPNVGWDGPYHGLDLGFSADPTVLVKCWVFDNRLYVQAEAWGLRCDINRLPELLDQVDGPRDHTIRVDSSRPETVSYLKQHGFPNTVSVDKWPDSVKDGISRMRAFDLIVIHPCCTHTIEEFRLYSYRIDRLSGDVLPDILGKNDHCIDAIRYAIAPLIKMSGGAGLVAWYQQQAKGIKNKPEGIRSDIGERR